MKTFTLTEQYTIVCRWEKTRYGFRHLATLIKDGYEVAKAKACNRTCESFEYQSVVHQLIDKHFKKDLAVLFKEQVDNLGLDRCNDELKSEVRHG